MDTRRAIAVAGLVFGAVMVATARPIPLGTLVELRSPTDVYRVLRSLHRPAIVLAYAGAYGRALREALAERAAELPDALILAMEAGGVLTRIPPEAFRESFAPELEGAGLDTLALAIDQAGARRRWASIEGEGEPLSPEATTQAEAVVAFVKGY